MVKEYTLRAGNTCIETEKSKIIQDLNERIGADQSCKVLIQPYDLRSLPALRAYWVMVNNVVRWDADNHGYKADIWDEWFKREAGLVDEVDMMPLWKIKYKDKIRDGWIMQDPTGLYRYNLLSPPKISQCILLRERYMEKTRSISNKGDVTKDEMSRLLMTVIKFGAENEIPDCFIKKTDFENMLKGFKDE